MTAPDGTRIEVKSSGFLQAWAQKKLSTRTSQVKVAYGWDATTGDWSLEQGFNADVYVFCLHHARTHDECDPLVVSQWILYVTGRATVERQAGASMGLSTLNRVVGGPVPYAGSGRRSQVPPPTRCDQAFALSLVVPQAVERRGLGKRRSASHFG